MEDVKNTIEEQEIATVPEEVSAEAESAASKNTEENALTENYTQFELSGLTEKQRRQKMIIDKITTGILILLMASPILIVLYILLWFTLR